MAGIFSLFLFGFVATVTPGPNNFMIMDSGLNFGVKKSLPHYFGICLGFPIMVLVVALGFGVVFLKYSWLRQVLKVIGTAYMLYLAWKITLSTGSSTNSIAKPLSFFQASIFQWINPKAWLMAIGAISIFTISSNYLYNAIAVSSLFLMICIPCTGIWLMGGVSLQSLLKEENYRKWFNIIMAICLVISIATMMFD